MKFKKVEIQAFRAYDDVNDGTFNFETDPNVFADFIAIYAPNGFGKTSFYDAVEWGFTNKINRFDKNEENDQLAKEERGLVKDSGERKKQYIIRNRFSKQDQGFVRLYTTTSQGPIERTIPQVHVGQTDYRYKDQVSIPGTEFFHDVLLSQEYIDAFLKEDDAKQRYQKFINFFGDKKLDGKYKLISSLIRLSESKIAAIKKESSGVQSMLSFDTDEDILSVVNEKIAELNKLGEQFELVGVSFTDAEYVHFSNLINERIVRIEAERLSNSTQIASVNIAILGNDSISSLGEYFEINKSLKTWEEGIVVLDNIRVKIDQRKVIADSVESLQLKRNLALAVRDELIQLRDYYPSYSRAKLSIALLNKSLEEHRSSISQLSERVIELVEVRAEISIQEKGMIERQSLISKEIADAPELYLNLSELTKQRDEAERKLALRKQEVNKAIDQKNVYDVKARNISALMQELKSGVFNIILDTEFLQFRSKIDDLTALQVSIERLVDNLTKLNEKIHRQEVLNTDIKEFVARGAEIVNATQSSACPLCSEQYINYNVLLDKITRNTVLDEALAFILHERRNVENALRDIKEEFARQMEVLLEEIGSLENNINSDVIRAKEIWSKEIRLFENEQEELTKLNSRIVLITNYFDGRTLNQFLELRGLESQKINTALLEIRARLDGNNSEHNRIAQEIELAKNKIGIELGRLEELTTDISYSKVDKYFRERSHLPETVETIVTSLNEFNASLSVLAIELEANQNNLKLMDDELGSYSEEKVTNDYVQLSEKISVAKQAATVYQRFLQVEFNFLIENKSHDEVRLFLTETEKSIKIKDLGLESIIQKLSLLLQLKDSVLPYLKFQEQKRTLSQLKMELEFQETRVLEELKNERKKLSDFIHDQVQSFFYEGVINKLYQKIDPHPEFKQIRFRCDFSGDEPRLNVFVMDENSSNPMIPSLYFSTAQLNILSLSIFLAKALNTKDSQGKTVDCIFIDDPIQAMDSINVLSTIDLIRSIVVNMGKQIILSTHDENFYNLLMKKIPEKIFNSKYLELETFGKVKQQHMRALD